MYFRDLRGSRKDCGRLGRESDVQEVQMGYARSEQLIWFGGQGAGYM